MPLSTTFLIVFILFAQSLWSAAPDPADRAAFRTAYANYQHYAQQEDWSASLRYAKETWELSRQLYGDAHPNTAKTAHNLALNLARLKRNSGADYIYRSALTSYEATYGIDSVELIPLLLDMADNDALLMTSDQQDKRDVLLQRALKLGKQHYQTKSLEYANLLVKTGAIYGLRVKDKKRARYLLEGYKLTKNLSEENSQEVAEAAYAVGKYYLSLKKYKDALRYSNEAWLIYSATPKQNPFMQLSVLIDLIGAHYQLADTDDVARYRTKIQQLEMLLGNAHEQLIVETRPVRPPESDWKNKFEWVRVKYDIDAFGSVINAEVDSSSGNNKFHAPSLEAIKEWIYSPRIRDGKAVPIRGASKKFRYFRGN